MPTFSRRSLRRSSTRASFSKPCARAALNPEGGGRASPGGLRWSAAQSAPRSCSLQPRGLNNGKGGLLLASTPRSPVTIRSAWASTALASTQSSSAEIVPDPLTGKPKCYTRGSYIHRLAGRNRQKSASLYTPQVLTSCQIKYTLKEPLVGMSAADILQLKLLEMAMGSAAYLNELVNQLTQACLERRQQETGRSIPHERYATELRKVKMRLADQNVFGVDLNRWRWSWRS